MEIASSADLYARPQHPYTRALLSAIPSPDPERQGRPPDPQGRHPEPGQPAERLRLPHPLPGGAAGLRRRGPAPARGRAGALQGLHPRRPRRRSFIAALTAAIPELFSLAYALCIAVVHALCMRSILHVAVEAEVNRAALGRPSNLNPAATPATPARIFRGIAHAKLSGFCGGPGDDLERRITHRQRRPRRLPDRARRSAARRRPPPARPTRSKTRTPAATAQAPAPHAGRPRLEDILCDDAPLPSRIARHRRRPRLLRRNGYLAGLIVDRFA